MKPWKIILLSAVLMALAFSIILIEYNACDGRFVRGWFWFECIKGADCE